MVTMMFCCRVADYDTWRPLYESAMNGLAEVRSWQVWRGQDDPNFVITKETFDSRDVAEGLLASDEIKNEMASHGVDPSSVQVWFLDEAGSS